MTARLLKEAEPQEIVMNEAFYLDTRAVFERLMYKDHFRDFLDVVGPCSKTLKGFGQPEKIYRWRGPRLDHDQETAKSSDRS